ncbi:uncharacterized protein N7459_004757 [Penicillium hispanicum]|uniref:uncharacterized protein n=1 Tax=Penicillium hispanicum TaxID=1080232 RepID=UPI0025404FBC|nr:uncharacterized protein N7459_004757 [Penicillium hispanicum]KAJ5584957.1 hypothetical protein N7459_004757 [Penicillium hispanicum]
MSWDRVIQDSDEEEGFVEDGIPTSIDPPQGRESPMHQPDEPHPADQQADYPIEQTATQDAAGAQLSVNFDQYLQSQEEMHPMVTSSQQQREQRWIPSTNEGGGGSIGAMMTEIGLAQQRLLDDGSSAGQHLPSTGTVYSSEISQPGSFPTTVPFQYQQADEMHNQDFAYIRGPQDISYEATQLVAPIHAPTYDYSTPAASTYVDSPFEGTSEQVTTFPSSAHLTEGTHITTWHKTVQRSKSMQSATYSPHDTEPLSSVSSPRLNRAKSDLARSGLVSPQHSPADTHDELSMPAVAVEVPTPPVKKKRGRPKKQSVPENDDDDELAMPQDSESDQMKVAEKRRPGRPPKAAADMGGNLHSPETPGDETTKLPDGANPTEGIAALDSALEVPGELANPVTTKPKKKKVKRSKTASAVLQKPRESEIDDDVIWVDSRPLQMEGSHEATPAETPAPVDTAPTLPESAPTTSTEENTPVPQTELLPAPKKRGRKRKKTAEQPEQVAPAPEEPQQAPDPQPPKPTTTVAENTVDSHPETEQGVANAVPGPGTTPQPEHATLAAAQDEAPPQTPQRNEVPSEAAAGDSTRKGPIKHSPISSTSKVPYRVGLSRRARIAPLLKIVRK